jgi:Rrf2 family protein
MRYTTKTEYGLICMVYLAKRHGSDWISIKEIAKEENYSVAYIEKILQALRQANLVTSQEGNHGGYALTRRPGDITLRQIIDALEGSTFDVFCEPQVREEIVCNHICLCGAKPIWKKTKDVLDRFFDSITLEMLVKPQAEVQAFMSGMTR